jgi:hypothetical protein
MREISFAPGRRRPVTDGLRPYGEELRWTRPVVLWAVFALWIFLSIVASSSRSLAVMRAAAGAVVLVCVRAVAWYGLPRLRSLRARVTSTDVDLEKYSQKIVQGWRGKPDPAMQKIYKELRSRYGRRVPRRVVYTWLEASVSNAKEEYARLVAGIDDRVFTINELRRMLARYPEASWGRSESARTINPDQGEYERYCARLLLRLELAYGLEIPGSVVMALMSTDFPVPDSARLWNPKR